MLKVRISLHHSITISNHLPLLQIHTIQTPNPLLSFSHLYPSKSTWNGSDCCWRYIAWRHGGLLRWRGSASTSLYTLSCRRQKGRSLWSTRRFYSHLQVNPSMVLFFTSRSSDSRAPEFQFLLVFLWIFLGFVFLKLSWSNKLFGFSLKHVPGFIENGDELKAKGIDDILLISGILL